MQVLVQNKFQMKLKKHIPNFEVSYNPDFRQEIVDSYLRPLMIYQPNRIGDGIRR